MAVNRPQASELLNMSEMRLFDDSRPGALRGMTRAALAARIARTRAARDRARDLLKRQKQAARTRGDTPGGRTEVAIRTERKEALLVDILQRFVEARRDAPETGTAKMARASTTKAAQAAAAKPEKAAGARSVARPVARKSAAGKAATAAAPAAKEEAARKTARKPAKRLTPDRALANTRELLAAKQQRDREAQPWQSLDPTASHVPDAGFQSPEAKAKAGELHAAESRMASTHGSMSARDRHAQGRRDHRGDSD